MPFCSTSGPLSTSFTGVTNEGSVPFWSNRVRVLLLCMLAHWKHCYTRGSQSGFQMSPSRCATLRVMGVLEIKEPLYNKWNRALISIIINTCEGRK